jgi:hypothetical protein
MADRNIEQINHNLDQVLAVAAESARNITRLEGIVEQTGLMIQDFIASAKPRLLSLETSREIEEEKVEELENNRIRMERAHLEHQERLNQVDARMERDRLTHEERMAQMERDRIAHEEGMERNRIAHEEQMAQMECDRAAHEERMEQHRLAHQERIDRQDRLIELLSRSLGESSEN